MALLACVGLALLQLVSAEQENQELDNGSKQGLEPTANEIQVRMLRDADAKKRRKNKKKTKDKKAKRNQKKGKKVKRNQKKGKKVKRNQKMGKKVKRNQKKGKKMKRKIKKGKKGSKATKKSKEGKRKNAKKSKRNNKKRTRQTKQATCDVEALCQKIKDYIKYLNQLRKLKRINSTCSIMEEKAAKAGEGEFTASGEANADTGDSSVTSISDELKNCTASAKVKCETKAISGCMVPDLHVKCMAELQGWIEKFGPKTGSCLQSSKDCCACINSITPAPSAECLNFEAMNTDSLAKKKSCTGSGEKGSFGYCRQLQHSAAEKGPAAAKLNCGGGSASTAGAAGRRMGIRKNLLKKWNNH